MPVASYACHPLRRSRRAGEQGASSGGLQQPATSQRLKAFMGLGRWVWVGPGRDGDSMQPATWWRALGVLFLVLFAATAARATPVDAVDDPIPSPTVPISDATDPISDTVSDATDPISDTVSDATDPISD